ncbi:hypothetical protein FVEG_01454 [Fusarium verticillioides 7600]|uniref:Ubiquitin-like domain-containing protein n=35 Tax=Fusarium TaxID=5506 RepID=W7LFA1_GIBM7|nr:hypothetical protein FVEG_01454 [Fusarium verticillioides 7600]EWG38138.1 hypothetical protein FVEG_01454 [Fusarium verticillioides 7600]
MIIAISRHTFTPALHLEPRADPVSYLEHSFHLDQFKMSNENENGTPGEQAPANSEHLNIKVTDNNNEVFFKIKRTTKLEKLMGAFCERQGKATSSVRFLFDGTRVQPTDTPDALEMQDGDTLEVHQEQVGGSAQ